MSWPKNADEWWNLCGSNAAPLRRLVRNFHPLSILSGHRRFPITAAKAERECEVHRKEVAEQELRDAIWKTYEPGQEVLGAPSEQYLEAAQFVQHWIKQHLEGKAS